MQIKLSIDNRFISLCNVDTEFDDTGKKKISEAWKLVERFINNSNFAGVQNLIVSLDIDGTVFFDKTKVRLKKSQYKNVFNVFEEFLQDKIYFFKQLEEEEKTDFLCRQYQSNLKQIKIIHTLSEEMKDD